MLCGLIAIMGALVTVLFVDETRGLSLEQISSFNAATAQRDVFASDEHNLELSQVPSSFVFGESIEGEQEEEGEEHDMQQSMGGYSAVRTHFADSEETSDGEMHTIQL